MPITLGPFTVGPDGALLQRPGLEPPSLRFAWRGRTCEALLADDALTVAAIAGRIPSTALAAADRPRLFAALSTMPQAMPAGWRVRLLPDHRVQVEAAERLGSPPTATRLVAALVRFALALDPYLDRLEAEGAQAG